MGPIGLAKRGIFLMCAMDSWFISTIIPLIQAAIGGTT
jgi:hypothetical protein